MSGTGLSSRWSRKRHSGRHSRGAAAVEFALVAWPVIFIIGAICEVGIFVLTQFELQYAVDNVTRQVRLNTAANSGWTDATFKQEVCRRIVLIRNCETALRVNVQGAPNFAQLRNIVPQPSQVGPTTGSGTYNDVFRLGAPSQAGSVIVTYDWRFIFPFMRIFSNVSGYSEIRRLYGLSVFRHEAA